MEDLRNIAALADLAIQPSNTITQPSNILNQGGVVNGTTFTSFPHLPFELRTQIWKTALQEPRNLLIYTQTLNQNEGFVGPLWPDHINDLPKSARLFKYNSNNPPPLLHVNHESRTEALKVYKLAFGTSFKGGKVTSPPRSYINWSLDQVCLQLHSTRFGIRMKNPRMHEFFNLCAAKRLKHLAINVENCQGNGQIRKLAAELTHADIGLEELTIFSFETDKLISAILLRNDSRIEFSQLPADAKTQNCLDGTTSAGSWDDRTMQSALSERLSDQCRAAERDLHLFFKLFEMCREGAWAWSTSVPSYRKRNKYGIASCFPRPGIKVCTATLIPIKGSMED